jgi:hypothetical protein
MIQQYRSDAQKNLFLAAVSGLKQIGYSGELLQRMYAFPDLFNPGAENVVAPAAAFARAPFDPNTACFAVLLSNGESGEQLVAKYRSLGAPRAFEVREDVIVHWRVGANTDTAKREQEIRLDDLTGTFTYNRDKWSPASVLRAKNITAPRPKQLDLGFVDFDLLPAIESQIRKTLDPLLREVLSEAKHDYFRRTNEEPDPDRLFRTLFRALTGKVMHDRDLKKFDLLDGPSDPSLLLRTVAEHYADKSPIINDRATQRLIVERIWNGMNFRHLSIEVLTFIWENTLVTDLVRQASGIHATPANVARYVAHRLIDVAPDQRRRIVEPCCGSGTFMVAALNQLRDLIEPEKNPSERHRYFAKLLAGFDTETFGIEVARSCLTLADFPNANGWQVENEDVFSTPLESPEFMLALGKARFVLCNPPFEPFTDDEREDYDTTFVQKAAEVLFRVLDWSPADCEIGFVLPHQAINGPSFRSLRRQIAERFANLDVVHLPEGVFKKAKFPSILLIAKNPGLEHQAIQLRFSRVKDPEHFVNTGRVDETEDVEKSREEIEASLGLVALGELWDFLAQCDRLHTIVDDIARGVEWTQFSRDRHVSDKPLRGFVPGFSTSEEMYCFEPPPVVFLSAKKDERRRNAWNKPWHRSKVVCNAVRRSAGPWKISACPVKLNLLCSQNFTVLWPKPPCTANVISAILNGPIACAFVSSRERWKHLTKTNISEIPIPNLTSADVDEIDSLVDEYQRLAAIRSDNPSNGLFGEKGPSDGTMTSLLRKIDRKVFDAYGLTPDLVSQLIDFFGGFSRPVSFSYDIGSMFDDETESGHKYEPSWAYLMKAMQDQRP